MPNDVPIEPQATHSDSLRARVEVIVVGRVQGVGYRFFAQLAAEGLGLTGWVANLPDGRVRCVAEGPRPQLERLLTELRRGPSGARVNSVGVAWAAATNHFDRFSVRSGSHPGD